VIPKFKNRAACEGTDTDQWFSKDSGEYSNEQLLFRICSGCPAKNECLNYALEYRVTGYWAGTTDRRRKELRRQLGIQAKSVIVEWEMGKQNA
jgi:hypothetical protein